MMEKRMKKETVVRRIVLAVIKFMVALAAVIVCLGITATARTRMEREEKQRLYLQNKQVVLSEVRAYVTEQGYKNSGITLTRREDGEGTEEWMLCVHHGTMDSLGDEERDELACALETLVLKGNPEATVRVKIN